jgi:hypothetical protein
MTEVLNDQNEQRNPRPIGRFLLGLEGYTSEHDPFEYAKNFVSQSGNFHKYRNKFLKIKEQHELDIDGRAVELEFSVSRNAYIWKVIMAAEQFSTESIGTAYVPHGVDKYELRCAQPKSRAEYRESNVQGIVIRRREFADDERLAMLQGLVERLLEGPVTEPDQ